VIAIVLLPLILVNTVLSCLIALAHPEVSERYMIEPEFTVAKIHFKCCLTIQAFILTLCLLIFIVGLSVPKWVYWEYQDEKFEGSLYKVKDFGEIEEYPWQ
jgi:hypothetical protein